MIIYNKKKLYFSFIILLILVTTFLDSTNYLDVKTNQQQRK